MMYKNPMQLQWLHRYNKMRLGRTDDECQENEKVCIHEDEDDDDRAMMR